VSDRQSRPKKLSSFSQLVLPRTSFNNLPSEPKEIRVVGDIFQASSEFQDPAEDEKAEDEDREKQPSFLQLSSQNFDTPAANNASAKSSPRADPNTITAFAANAPAWFNQFPYELQDKCMDLIRELQQNEKEPCTVVAELEACGIPRERGTELIQHVCLPPRLLNVRSDIGVQTVPNEGQDRQLKLDSSTQRTPSSTRGPAKRSRVSSLPEGAGGGRGPVFDFTACPTAPISAHLAMAGSAPPEKQTAASLGRPIGNSEEVMSQWIDENEPNEQIKFENLESSPRQVHHWPTSSMLQVPRKESCYHSKEDSIGFSSDRPFDVHAHSLQDIIVKFEERVVEDVLASLSSEKNQCRIMSDELNNYNVPSTIGEQAQLHIDRERNRRKFKRREERIKRMVMHLRHEHVGSLTFESKASEMSMVSQDRRYRVTSDRLDVPNFLAMPSFSDTEGGSISPFDMNGSEAGQEAGQIDERLSQRKDEDPKPASSLTKPNVMAHTSATSDTSARPPSALLLSRLSQRYDSDDLA